MDLKELVEYLDNFFEVKKWNDKSINGLQVEGKSDVSKVAFAVDACMEVFVKAKQLNADMIIVHHGLIWEGIKSVRGITKARLKFLLENDISLYAVHLPLDAHPTIGNNVQLLRLIDVEPEDSFAEYNGRNVGYFGKLESKKPLDSIINTLKDKLNANLSVLKFGKDEVEWVGAVSGRGSFALAEAIDKGLDLFITGEADHSIYHLAKESQINVIFAGHYATETVGLKALMNVIRDEFELDTIFIDVPTNL